MPVNANAEGLMFLSHRVSFESFFSFLQICCFPKKHNFGLLPCGPSRPQKNDDLRNHQPFHCSGGATPTTPLGCVTVVQQAHFRILVAPRPPS
jgi:hypothetical protein